MTAIREGSKAKIIHLLDDFGMGGVVRALGVFQEPELAASFDSETLPVAAATRIAPKLTADIIITHFPPSWARLSYFMSLRLRNPAAKLIHVEHSYTRNFEHLHVSNPRRFRLMLKLALRPFDHVICVSNGQRQWLAQASGLNEQRSRTIYPWSGRDELLGLAPPVRDSNSPLRLAAYGRYDAIKNFSCLIDAVGSLGSAAELHLGGSGPEETTLIEKAAGLPNIHLHGQISDIGAFLAKADAVIVPSMREAYGLVATEARLAARPIIAADVDGLPEQVGQGGIAAPCHTPADIVAAITAFNAMPFDAMSMAARRDSAALKGQIISQWKALLSQ